jgi:hypothetical protein
MNRRWDGMAECTGRSRTKKEMKESTRDPNY